MQDLNIYVYPNAEFESTPKMTIKISRLNSKDNLTNDDNLQAIKCAVVISKLINSYNAPHIKQKNA